MKAGSSWPRCLRQKGEGLLEAPVSGDHLARRMALDAAALHESDAADAAGGVREGGLERPGLDPALIMAEVELKDVGAELPGQEECTRQSLLEIASRKP
jgi:hypothetical protein